MEKLLHYCWKHRLFSSQILTTAKGSSVEVVDVGLHNHNDGPDFFNAKILIDGVLHVGNVELHVRSGDWYLHHHEIDPHYNNVVLHVCEVIDREAVTENGFHPPQVELRVPKSVRENYEDLLREDRYPPCYKIIFSLPSLTIHAWMSALQTERLEEKTLSISNRASLLHDDWEKTLFATIARNFGFGINGDAFEAWSAVVDLSATAHHRDDEFQVEAIFMGQAGFLSENNIPERLRLAAVDDSYFQRLKSEYTYLKHKFNLSEMNPTMWRFLRLRPQNFPYIRLSQLVTLYCQRNASLQNICDAVSINELERLLDSRVTPYWQSHYTFGNVSKTSEKHLSKSSLRLLIINTVVPVLFAYGRYRGDEKLCERAVDFLEQIRAEDNSIVRMWQECGLSVETAGDSQALIQLKKKYCDRRDCLRCRFGYEYLKKHR